jgi:hypothetical protein
LVLAAVLAGAGCAHVRADHFSGTVSAIDCGCWADATCTLTIEGRTVTFGQGWSRASWGRVDGLVGCEESVGMQADVYARRFDGARPGEVSGYSLEGSPDYFVRLHRRPGALQPRRAPR